MLTSLLFYYFSAFLRLHIKKKFILHLALFDLKRLIDWSVSDILGYFGKNLSRIAHRILWNNNYSFKEINYHSLHVWRFLGTDSASVAQCQANKALLSPGRTPRIFKDIVGRVKTDQENIMIYSFVAVIKNA